MVKAKVNVMTKETIKLITYFMVNVKINVKVQTKVVAIVKVQIIVSETKHHFEVYVECRGLNKVQGYFKVYEKD